MDDQEGTKRLTIRIPKELHQKLEERTKETRRNLNMEMITLLERFVDSKEVSIPNEELQKCGNKADEYFNGSKGGTGSGTQAI